MEPEEWPEDSGYRPPLPPEDRLWRHPSELPPITEVAASGASDRRGRSLLTVTLIAGAATSALLVTGLLAVTVGLGARHNAGGRTVVTSTAALTTSPLVVSRVAGRDGPRGLATVSIVTAAGRRTGAAVALDNDGTLVTSAALVADALTVNVALDDGTRRPATVAGLDLEAGIAVLTIPVPSMRAAALGTAARLGPGDAVHLRDPLASSIRIDGTVRQLGQEAPTATGSTVKHLISLDAPAWCVSEGAAVVDDSGRVVGFVTLDATGTVRAVPIDLAVSAADGVAGDGAVHAALFGVEAHTLDEKEAAALGVTDGVLVKELNTPGPALDAGIGVGDVILAVDGEPVRSVESLVIMIRSHQPGDRLEVQYVHGGEHLTAVVVLAERALWT